jgi:predicted metalloenzyme YecM
MNNFMDQKSEQISAIVGDYKVFLEKIFSNLKKAGFENDEFEELDHLAYRTESFDSYEAMKKKLLKFSLSNSEVMISDRPITVFRLKEALTFDEFFIECIEILAPKAAKKYADGLEHAEFVIRVAFDEFIRKHKDIEFDYNSYSREINPELKLQFRDCSVKFHTQSLLKIRSMK